MDFQTHQVQWTAAQVLPLLLGLAAAVVIDLRTRRIPNWLVLAILCSGLLMQVLAGGAVSLLQAAAGFGVGLAVLLPFWLLGGFGAGDVKLMAATGAWLGAQGALLASAATLVAGSLIAVVVVVWMTLLRAPLAPAAATMSLLMNPREGLRGMRGTRFPYALAIATGVVAVLLWRIP